MTDAQSLNNYIKLLVKWDRKRLRSDFVPPHDERHLSTPGVNKGRPAGVHGDILPAAGAHPQGRVVDWLPSKLKDWREMTKHTCEFPELWKNKIKHMKAMNGLHSPYASVWHKLLPKTSPDTGGNSHKTRTSKWGPLFFPEVKEERKIT